MKEHEWPPKDGRKFVRSDEFGRLVVDEVVKLGDIYPKLDFADAVATTFQWFNSKLNANRSFISKKRFPSLNSFRAYVRQMLYNAGLRAMRFRKARRNLSAVPENEAVIESPASSAQQKEQLLKLVNQLEEPHKTIFTRFFFDEDPLYLIAGSMDFDKNEAHQIYEEAVDQIGKLAKKSNIG